MTELESLTEFRAFLDDVRLRATAALLEDFARFEEISMEYGEACDPADVHEDIRETLWPFFTEIRHCVEGPECPKVVSLSENTGSKCQLIEGHSGPCKPWSS